MFRVLLALLGVYLIYGGIAYKLDNGEVVIGILLLLPVIIPIIRKIIEEIDYRNAVRNYHIEQENKAQKERQAKEKAAEEQRQLIEQYRTSSLTLTMLDTISGGNFRTNLPERIVIYNDRVLGTVRGKTYTYDFSENRVHNFSSVYRVIPSTEELKYVVRPQIAMAEAINSLARNKYEIYDNAQKTTNFHTDCDGDEYTTLTYASDHVTMVLKSTLPNKHF